MTIRHEWIPDAGGIFDMTDYSGFGVQLVEGAVEGLGNPKTDSFTHEPALLDGQTFDGWRALPRDVFWPVLINSDEAGWDVLQQAWWATLRPGQYGLWRVTKDDDTYRDLRCRFVNEEDGAYATDPSIDGLEVHGIALVADVPWWVGPAVAVTFQEPSDALPFFEPGPTHVFNLMSANTVDDATITNPGQLPAWPIIRIDGPSTGFAISDYVVTYMPAISGTIDVPDGEYLLINTDPRVQTAQLSQDGQTWMLDVTEQLDNVGFFRIPPGTSTLYATINGAGSMTVTITPRFYRAI